MLAWLLVAGWLAGWLASVAPGACNWLCACGTVFLGIVFVWCCAKRHFFFRADRPLRPAEGLRACWYVCQATREKERYPTKKHPREWQHSLSNKEARRTVAHTEANNTGGLNHHRTDLFFKLLVVGESGVGKTCLLLRFVVCSPSQPPKQTAET